MRPRIPVMLVAASLAILLTPALVTGQPLVFAARTASVIDIVDLSTGTRSPWPIAGVPPTLYHLAATTDGRVVVRGVSGNVSLFVARPEDAALAPVAPGAGLGGNEICATDTDVYLADFGRDAILRVSLGTHAVSIVSAGGWLVDAPLSIDLDPTGALLVRGIPGLVRVKLDGSQHLLLANSETNWIQQAVHAPSGPLWVLAHDRSGPDFHYQLESVELATGSRRVVLDHLAFLAPNDLALMPDGRLLVADSGLGIFLLDPVAGTSRLVTAAVGLHSVVCVPAVPVPTRRRSWGDVKGAYR